MTAPLRSPAVSRHLMEIVVADMTADPRVGADRIQRYLDDPKRCTGDSKSKKRAGADPRCGLPAVLGAWGCEKFHCASQAAQAKALRRVERANAELAVRQLELEVPEDLTAQEVLQETIKDQVAYKRKLKRHFEELGDEITQVDVGQGGVMKVVPHVHAAMYADALKSAASIARMGIQSGLEERKVELDQAQLRLHVQELLPRITGLLETLGHSLDDPKVTAALEAHFS